MASRAGEPLTEQDLFAVRDVWPGLVERLQGVKCFGEYLLGSWPLRVEGDGVVLGIVPEHEANLGRLTTTPIERLLAQTFERSIGVQLEVAAAEVLAGAVAETEAEGEADELGADDEEEVGGEVSDEAEQHPLVRQVVALIDGEVERVIRK